MDYSVAEMSCVLSASVQCEACRAKVYEILQNIYGVYTISMDSEEGTVKISGKVNPRALLRVLENSGKHAEVKSIRFDGEVREKRHYPYGDDYTSHDLPYPHPLFDCPEQNHWFDRSYHFIPLGPPPPPPSYPWQPPLQPVPWPPQVPLPPSAPWPMPMGPLPRPPSMMPATTPWPPRPQPPPPPDEAFKGETVVISSDPDKNHKCCTIM